MIIKDLKFSSRQVPRFDGEGMETLIRIDCDILLPRKGKWFVVSYKKEFVENDIRAVIEHLLQFQIDTKSVFDNCIPGEYIDVYGNTVSDLTEFDWKLQKEIKQEYGYEVLFKNKKNVKDI